MHIVSRVGIGKVPPSSPLFLDVGGAVNFDSTLRVIGQTTVNALISSQIATNTLVYESRIVGETNVLFSINRDGKMEWGAGGVLIPDVNLYRSAAGILQTNGSITIDNSLIVGNTTSDTATFTARIASSLDPSATNSYSLGQDTLRWQNLWLSIKLTSVDGLFTGNLQVDNNTTLGSSSSDTLTVNAFVASQLTPSVTNTHNLGSATNKWASLWLGTNLQVDGNTILGDATSDTITFTARAASSLLPSTTNSYDFGSSSNKWRSLWLGTNLQVDGNTILGDASSDTLTVNAFVASQLTPSTTNTHNLGSATNKWASLWLGSNLQVDGNTILGDSPSDTVTINAGFASPMNPSVDNTYALGLFNFRWKELNVGNNGVIVRNDATNTEKASFYFKTGSAYVESSSTVKLFLTTAGNNGLLIDTMGRVGVNKTGGLIETFTVDGTSDFADTAFFSKASGYGLKVQSVAGISGSIESSNASKQLNIGINAETEFINLGTGNLTKTINIGTGSGKTTINIGGSSDIININGTVVTSKTIESFVSDKTLSLNVGGLNNTAQNSGLIIEEAGASFLSISDPTWQTGNTVRYSAANTGNIKAGSVVLISGFFNSQNNGQFTITEVVNNSYFQVENVQITDSSFNEIGATGAVTNPITAAKILVTTDRSAWDLTSPLNSSNYFRLSNLGADVELKSTTSGLSVVSSALIPETSNTPLGSVTKLWNGFLNTLNCYGNAVIGDQATDTLTVNGVTTFNEKINSDLIPYTTEAFVLGTSSYKWNQVHSRELYSYNLSEFTGTINLGVDNTTQISANGVFSSSLIPLNNTFDIGSPAAPWNTVYLSSLGFPAFIPGSVLFIDNAYRVAEDNDYLFWNAPNKQLYLGQNTGSYILDIAGATADSIRLRNSSDSTAIALRANSASTKIEYTTKLEFGANTYANVGNGAATSVLELTNNAVRLLGAVSVNSVSTSAATYTVQPTDVIINVNTAVSGCTITLPSAATKRLLVIKDIGNNASASGRAIQLSPAASQYVEFNAINTAYVIDRDGESVTLQSDGTSRWYII